MKRLVLAAALAAAGARPADACKTVSCSPLDPFATADAAQLASADPETIARAALAFATSHEPAELDALARTLRDPDALARIARSTGGRGCALEPILRKLAANPAGRGQYASLLVAKAWAVRDDRNDGSDLAITLLRSTAAARPATPEVVAFWKKFVEPRQGYVNSTAPALVDNGAPEALALFEALLREPAHGDDRVFWLQVAFVAHRDNPALLRMARRLIAAKLDIAPALADVVFDYRQQWYGTCPGPPAPSLRSYTDDARREVRAIAGIVRAAGKPSATLEAAIAKTLAAL